MGEATPRAALQQAGEALAEELERQELSGDHDEADADMWAAAAAVEVYLRTRGLHDEAERVSLETQRIASDG